MEGAENIMSEEHKSKAELLQELKALRQRISKLEQVEQALRESENKHRDLIEEMTDVIYTLDTEGNVTSVNKAGKTTFGREPEEVLGKSFTKCIPQKHLPDATAAFKRILSGEKITTETVMLDKQGRPHNVEFSSSPIIEDGKVVGTRGIIRDITERKKAEELLKQAKEHAENLLEAITESVVITGLDGRIQQVNSAFERGTGWKRQELIGKTVVELGIMSEEEGQRIQNEIIPKLINEGTVRDFESIAIKRNGTKIHVLMNWTLLKNANGKPNSVITVSRNITERKKAEETLRESEEKWRSLAENAPDIILTVKPDGTILFLNRTVPPFTPEKAVGTSVYEYVPPDYQQTLRDALEQVVRTGEPCSYELAGSGPDGCISWYRSHLGPIKKNGRVVALILIATDITEHKQADDQLKQSENKYRTLLENLPQKIFLKDRNSVYISCNENLARDLNIKPEEIAGKTDYDFFSKELAEKYRADDKRIIKSGQTKDIEEKYIQDGQEFIVHTVKTPIRDEQGNVTGILGIFWDITEQKKMEEALRESQRWQRAILNSIPDMAWLKDKESKYIAANEALCKAFGIKSEDFVGKTDLDISPKDLAEKYRADDQEVIKSGKRKRVEEQWGKKKGERIWIETIKTPIFNDQGQIIGTSGIARDITERKKTEQKLRESEEKYRQVVSTSTDAIMLFDAETRRFVEINKACEELYGYSREEFLNLKLTDITAEPEKTRESIEQAISGRLHRIPIRYHRKKDGTVFPAEISASTFEFRGRRILCGVIRDITERKKAEERIQALSSAIEQSIDGIAIADLEPRLLYVNKAYALMHGFSPQEMIGMPVVKLQSSEQTFKSDISRLKIDGAGEAEVRHIKKDGTPFSIYLSATLLKDVNGQPTGILTIARDITDLKQREKEFDDYRQKMARSEQLASLGTLGAGLAHELTQPLTVITLLIENALMELEKAPCPGTIANKLKDVLAEASKVTSITKKFRSAVRKSSERVVRQVDLKAVAQRTIELFDESARRAKITLDIMGLDKLPNIYSSEEEIEQLFFALVENAIHAADNEKGCRFIICGTVKDNYVELQFSDNGSGIAPENLNKIFEPFFTTKPIGAATGLGLCIAEHIVSRAGGKIHVESKLGEGTTFYVTLPIKRHAKLYPK
jgi:PAS domain S-box-containing protein